MIELMDTAKHTPEQAKPEETDIDKVKALKPGEFWVKRSGQPSYFEKGWTVVETYTQPDGTSKLIISPIDDLDTYKQITDHTLLTWQRQGAAEHAESDRVADVKREGAQVLRSSQVEVDKDGLIVVPDWLGKKATEVPEVHEVAKPKTRKELMDELVADLSDDDRAMLFNYASAARNKADAQKSGNGPLSILYGQNMGEFYQKLSPAANSVLPNYVELFNR